MEEKLQSFLQSGLLERYLVGDTSIAENLEVEHQIDNNPEIAEAFEELQTNLEIVAKANAVEAPLGVLNKILESTKEETKVITMPQRKTPWYSIAASVAAVGFGLWSLVLYQKNQALSSENNIVVEEIFDLRDDIDKNNSKLDALAIQLQKLNNPDSRKYVLEGNERAKNLKTVAYINPIEKTSMIDVVSLPKLPENQYYQLRAELEDKMVSLGYLEDYQRSLKPIPYMEDALALSIVIQNKNGSSSLEETEVAEISLKDN
ncbi:hypothetical protein DFQ05_1074 [Winogradskyella wandonensis]|uniref:Anti-sigma-K factor rskA n=1 Tax=Winogradskyella wandonensis TaxID=1442586 RepID=A0A4R1KRU6_9FLAO|nr:anti-sigma factor [Winogradskyella wandonensis]TCK67300.1 hypothetical protein DFQ05_1074 [Winogradskyella wandonensis]